MFFHADGHVEFEVKSVPFTIDLGKVMSLGTARLEVGASVQVFLEFAVVVQVIAHDVPVVFNPKFRFVR